ncbi:DUF342 domain-containing protein [Haliovirga abyssi]|uniref:Flagellar Assembly Protein A N-terminal region domain-containing protein n=1 Tax=Haliovirga abyssi TaxID=2996794 RepID=A0AAU9D680_9FUSO|nr:FapA family protein [Haliovirga abyssi]BDU51551.1 hypothetical protein HLVA_21200 [Haliovirga abyssi]
MDKIKLNKMDEGVFVIVTEKISMDELISFIAENDVENPDVEKISYAFEHIGEEVKIAEYYGEISLKSHFEITVSTNKMEAYLIVGYSQGGKIPDYSDIIDELQNMGIIKGIKEKAIKDLIEIENFNSKIKIAEGKFPIDGKNSYTKYLKGLKKNKTKRPTIDIDGKADFKNINFLETVLKGEVLAKKISATKGVDGYDIFGNVLKAKDGKDIKLKKGKNTIITEDGMQIIANVDGMPIIRDNKIEVENVLMVEEVGVETGNIDFNGSVVVRGDVKSEYIIKATGEIQVLGNVENAILQSNGEIVIKGNCFGKEDSLISAEGDIFLNFAENIEIKTKKDLIINEGLINCKVYAEGKVVAITKSGSIIGGETRGEAGIEVLNAGSKTGAQTELKILGKSKVVERIKEKLKDIDWEIKVIEKNIISLQYIKKNVPQLYGDEKEELFMKLIKNKMGLLNDKKVLEIRYNVYKEKMEREEFPKIIVRNRCYFGVKITLKERNFEVNEDIERIKFFLKDDRVEHEFV